MKVYNTLLRKKEDFKPIKPGKVGIYVCGITAYDSCHLGHARAAISFDIITRHFRHKGLEVTYARNYTDIDDKIINRSNKEGKSCREISEKYIAEYKEDMASLGNLPPDIEPKATEHIDDMLATIQKLIQNGFAYEKNGNVFFSVRKFASYGKLSGKNIDDLESGARIDIDESKEDPLDFALWKSSKPGEPKWPSPWGDGRPGWHIECSSMSSKYLGQPFDIHGGGRDLIFPHHENEIAQAECAEGKQFANCWLHNGFININAEKMSKSLGNFTTIKDVVEAHGAEAVRYFIISNHYRSPIDYTDQTIHNSVAALDRFYETAKRIPTPNKKTKNAKAKTDIEKEVASALEEAPKAIISFMDDDFNTAGAFGAIFELVRVINRYLDTNPAENSEFYNWILTKWKETRSEWDSMFGVFGSDPNRYFEEKKNLSKSAGKIDESEIEALIAERKAARVAKDFARADEIRDKLDKMKIILKDRPDGTTEWQIK
jgi:cysteinyl-tRNA synthetase